MLRSPTSGGIRCQALVKATLMTFVKFQLTLTRRMTLEAAWAGRGLIARLD